MAKKKGKGCLTLIGVIVVLMVIVNLFGSGKESQKEQAKKNIATTEENSSKTKPKAENKKEDGVITSGHYQVGKDLPAGEYKVFSDSVSAYIEASKDSSGNVDSIIFNDNFSTFTYIDVSDGQYLKLTGCYAIPSEKAKKFDGSEIKDGMYKIGVDIPAGEYDVTANGTTAYIEVNAAPHGLESIVTNSNFENNELITVSDGQYFKIVGATAVKK